ncbi:hypothetical protein POTOM_023988 [Populus tomentosa]|uniref:RRM domain-containing protein n=1 Tax=Populus tomentosa TaxID=118781 RepID=A0A8X7ZMH8_POPTO|nr:hypothetical protein POTOM_023988 [Populus tomentosa]
MLLPLNGLSFSLVYVSIFGDLFSTLSKLQSGDRATVLCFVEFTDANCAATAMEALQGYKFDDKKPDSPTLKIQFARFPFRPPSDRDGKRIGTHASYVLRSNGNQANLNLLLSSWSVSVCVGWGGLGCLVLAWVLLLLSIGVVSWLVDVDVDVARLGDYFHWLFWGSWFVSVVSVREFSSCGLLSA